MEEEESVDLDSLLLSSSSDGDASPRHHLTVDEILLRHSSPPSSSPSPLLSIHTHSPDASNSSYPNSRTLTRPTSSTEFGSNNNVSGSGRVWAGGVRSYSKPGAALAAAAAASSSRMDAIKARRLGGSWGSSAFSTVEDESGSVNRTSNEGVSEFGLQALDQEDSVSDHMIQLQVSDDQRLEPDATTDRILVENDDFSRMEHQYHDGNARLGLDESPAVGSTMEFESVQNSGDIEADELNLIEDDIVSNEVQLMSSEVSDEVNMYNEGISASVGESEQLEKVVNMSNEGISGSVGESNELEEVLVTPSSDRKDGDVGVDESNSPNDVVDMVAELTLQWESRRGMKMSQKRCESSLELLELAEELEKKQAFTGLHWEAGAAALPMRLEGVRRGSDVLGYFDVDAHNFITQTISSEAFRRDHGSPQVLAVHFNYIAIGMSRGAVVVVSSKYTPHHADKMDPKILFLGLQGNRAYAPVTSMCFNQQGDLLFAGYADGHYTVWDVQRASALKVINEHKAPVVHLLYLGQNNVVSGDTKGIVKLIHFSVVPLLNRISYSAPTKLLDESTSTVVCAVPLISSEVHNGTSPSQGSNAVSTGGISSMMGGVVGGDSGWKLFDGFSNVEEGVVIFVTHQSALVAKLNPSIEVYAQLPKPSGLRDGAMPYAAWKYMVVSEEVSAETSDRVALLAIAWDRTVQVAKLVKSELKVHVKWDLEAPAVGVFWLSDQLLVVLTSSGQMCLFSRDGNLIHQTSFAMDGSPSDALISCHTYFTNKLGNPEKAHHNCVMVRGSKVYILGSKHLAVSRLLPWRERIEVLQRAGDWMGALYMAMTYYDGQAQAVIDLPRNLTDVQKTVMPYLLQLLFSYVDEVFSYISVACGKPDERPDSSVEHHNESNIEDSEAKEQYSRVGGVAVEFCLHINRTDILFDEIYSRFSKVEHQETFLELLEPYILKDMLGSLPPEIMQALVDHYSQRGWLQRVEQCVLHMDILSLDFNQVVRLCREHRLHGALIYLFNKGLNDFKTPLEELLIVLQNSLIESVPALGYRILIYLKYCFQGLAFPPGHGNIPPARLPSLRNELMQYLLESSSTPSSWSVSSISSDEVFRNLHHLLEFDTGSTLEVLKLAFEEDETMGTNDLPQDLNNSAGSLTEAEDNLTSQNNELVQKLVDVLSDILDMSYFQTSDSTESDDSKSIEIWPSKNDVKHVFDFIAYYVACKRAKVQKAILNQIVEYMTSEIKSSSDVRQQNHEVSKRREMQLLALLEAIPVAEWDSPYFLHLCEKAQFHQACGLINAIDHDYSAALDCYMNVMEEPIHAFSFIHDMLQKSGDSESSNIESAVTSRIQHLVKLSREGTFFMVLYHFPAKTQQILSELHSHPESLLLYLKTVFEVQSNGNLDFSHLKKCEILELPGGKGARLQSDRIETFLIDLMDFRKLVRSNTIQITDELTEMYLELLCRYERDSVLKFLETFESYRVDHCLRLCQEFGIVDAAAFLLERVGDVGSALLLHISDLNHKFVMLGSTFESKSSDGNMMNIDTLMKKKEVHDILDTLHACIELCQRNSPRLDPHEAEFLWFQLLDSVCEPLIADGQRNYYAKEPPVELLDSPSGNVEGDGASKAKWKVPISHRSAHTLRKLVSNFIKEIVEGMIGNVRLPEIMLKLLSDNGTQEFGDFKPTILGMLGTYDFERRILDTAKCLIEDDTYYTMSLLKKGASHGYALDSLSCCLCNCLLMRNTSGPGVRVYSCGHATHLHCELQDNETSVSGSTGCPICMPKKRAQLSKGISGLLENGLVNTSSRSAQHTNGTHAFHPHDSDAFENFQNSNQISRFELLHNLQKGKTAIQVENMPQLRLAPPSIYHEKVKKGPDMVRGESSSVNSKTEKPTKGKELKDVKVKKGSSIKFPLKTNIFGKEKVIKQR